MKSIKPLIRWTIGPTNPEGFEILEHSVELMRTVYPEFDLMICYNQIKNYQIEKLKKMNVDLYDSSNDSESLSIHSERGYNVHQKLYPPRLRPDSHEIILDNDVIFFNRIREIDCFLNDNKVLVCQGLNRLLGRYDEIIPAGIRVNSGIFGLPPYFDFSQELEKKISLFEEKQWTNRFDEQGLVAATLIDQKQYYIIPLTSVVLVEPKWDYKIMTNKLACGYHFVGANYNKQHLGWLGYKENNVKRKHYKFM